MSAKLGSQLKSRGWKADWGCCCDANLLLPQVVSHSVVAGCELCPKQHVENDAYSLC